jgi:hypothetical protein
METITIERSSSSHSPVIQPEQNGSHHPSEDPMTNLEQLIEVGTTILNQALDLLNNSLTSDEQLTVHSQYMPGSTIGMTSNAPPLLDPRLTLTFRQTSSPRTRPLYSPH